MRPGMPLGRKHFRRSRDAPMRKGLWTSPFVKELTLPYSECLNRSIILDALHPPRIQLKPALTFLFSSSSTLLCGAESSLVARICESTKLRVSQMDLLEN